MLKNGLVHLTFTAAAQHAKAMAATIQTTEVSK
jgi:hypothetical protein